MRREVDLWESLEVRRREGTLMVHLPVLLGFERAPKKSILPLESFRGQVDVRLRIHGWNGDLRRPTRDMKPLVSFIRRNGLLGEDIDNLRFVVGEATHGPEACLYSDQEQVVYLCGRGFDSGGSANIRNRSEEYALGLSQVNSVEFCYVPILQSLRTIRLTSARLDAQFLSSHHHAVGHTCPPNILCSGEEGRCILNQIHKMGEASGILYSKVDKLAAVKGNSLDEVRKLSAVAHYLHMQKESMQLAAKVHLNEEGSSLNIEREVIQIRRNAVEIAKVRNTLPASSRLTSFLERDSKATSEAVTTQRQTRTLTAAIRRVIEQADDYSSRLLQLARAELPAQITV